jgi:bifunctional non-homologous end joining protein LigD
MIRTRRALWVINLGCIDLNQWYATCDDVDRPDYVHFDLDPGAGATFDRVRETALVVREALDTLKMPSLVKTTGSRGLHVYVPIVRGPDQKQVWTFAKVLRSWRCGTPIMTRNALKRAARRSCGLTRTGGEPLARCAVAAPRRDGVHASDLREIRGRPHRGFTVENVPARVARLGDPPSRCSCEALRPRALHVAGPSPRGDAPVHAGRRRGRDNMFD